MTPLISPHFSSYASQRTIKHTKLSPAKPTPSFTHITLMTFLAHKPFPTIALHTVFSPHTPSLPSANISPPSKQHHIRIFPRLTTCFTPWTNTISWPQDHCALQQAILSLVRLRPSLDCHFCYQNTLLWASVASPQGVGTLWVPSLWCQESWS